MRLECSKGIEWLSSVIGLLRFCLESPYFFGLICTVQMAPFRSFDCFFFPSELGQGYLRLRNGMGCGSRPSKMGHARGPLNPEKALCPPCPSAEAWERTYHHPSSELVKKARKPIYVNNPLAHIDVSTGSGRPDKDCNGDVLSKRWLYRSSEN